MIVHNISVSNVHSLVQLPKKVTSRDDYDFDDDILILIQNIGNHINMMNSCNYFTSYYSSMYISRIEINK